MCFGISGSGNNVFLHNSPGPLCPTGQVRVEAVQAYLSLGLDLKFPWQHNKIVDWNRGEDKTQYKPLSKQGLNFVSVTAICRAEPYKMSMIKQG